jgi:hypothetical protein
VRRGVSSPQVDCSCAFPEPCVFHAGAHVFFLYKVSEIAVATQLSARLVSATHTGLASQLQACCNCPPKSYQGLAGPFPAAASSRPVMGAQHCPARSCPWTPLALRPAPATVAAAAAAAQAAALRACCCHLSLLLNLQALLPLSLHCRCPQMPLKLCGHGRRLCLHCSVCCLHRWRGVRGGRGGSELRHELMQAIHMLLYAAHAGTSLPRIGMGVVCAVTKCGSNSGPPTIGSATQQLSGADSTISASRCCSVLAWSIHSLVHPPNTHLVPAATCWVLCC